MDEILDFKDYYAWEHHMKYLDCLENKYPEHVEIITIGKSIENRDLKVIKIGKPLSKLGSTKPAVWIDGGIHAREWISPATVQYLIYQLVENHDSPENHILLENLDIYVLPILNPDGYASNYFKTIFYILKLHVKTNTNIRMISILIDNAITLLKYLVH